jgi:hypothetical protein
MLEPHVFISFYVLCFMFFDEWLDAMSPTEEVELTMMVNHRIYVFVTNDTKQVDHTKPMTYLRGVFEVMQKCVEPIPRFFPIIACGTVLGHAGRNTKYFELG